MHDNSWYMNTLWPSWYQAERDWWTSDDVAGVDQGFVFCDFGKPVFVIVFRILRFRMKLIVKICDIGSKLLFITIYSVKILSI